jgi:hypothetical protein
MIPLSLYIVSNHSNPLPLTCFLPFTYMGMHTIKTNDMTRQNRALDLNFRKEFASLIRTHSVTQNSAVKDPFRIVQNL